MRRKWIGAICSLLLLTATGWAQQIETVTYTYNGFSVPVLSDDSDTISYAEVFVPQALQITKVTARVQVQFGRVGDLNVDLYSPEGERVELLSTACGDLVNIDTSFDDFAPSDYDGFCPVEAGRGPFRPEGQLGDFNDEDSFGYWLLSVENNESDRGGWITGFSVTITGTRALTPTFRTGSVVNTGGVNYPGTIAPGELVSIIGYGLGPTAGVSAADGTLPLSLGGTTVTVNGVSVPIAYASNFRVNIQVPFDVTGPAANIVVSYNGQTNPPVPVNVYSARPGLFTLQPLGVGQVKAINANGNLNSKTNQAAKGSYIVVYASGLGSVDPPLPTGSVAPGAPISTAVAGVSAAIGGVPCEVTFAGLAPGLRGAYQLNILVDQDVPSGTQDLVISANGNPSQGNVFVEIQ